MRSFIASAALILVAAMLGSSASAEEADAKPRDVGATIDRGLAFLVKDALACKAEHNCATCHHAALIVWAMHEARQRGHAVDEPVLADLTKWLATAGDGTTSLPRPEGIPKALNVKPVWYALGLAADPKPDSASQEGLKLLLKTVQNDQTENGFWAAWPETRPPFFGNSNESMTVLAMLAVLPAAEGGNAAAKAVRDKGVQWLASIKADDGETQSLAMRLVLWQRVGRPADESARLVARLRERQNADGGWSQTKDMSSDPWATGQALYALAQAGIKPTDPAIARAHAFLIATQRDDGSWPMTSRPTKPGGEGSGSLIPITGGGSAWAVIGLARSR